MQGLEPTGNPWGILDDVDAAQGLRCEGASSGSRPGQGITFEPAQRGLRSSPSDATSHHLTPDQNQSRQRATPHQCLHGLSLSGYGPIVYLAALLFLPARLPHSGMGLSPKFPGSWPNAIKLTQVAAYRQLRLQARTKRKTFSSKPAAVTACIVLGSMRSLTLPTVSILLR
jgi:hypothetical protein